MVTLLRSRATPGSIWTPRTDRSEVLYAPLWHPSLAVAPGGTFQTKDRIGHIATVTGATWGRQGYTFDGLGNYIAIAANNALKLEDGVGLTYLLWVYVRTLQTTTIIGSVTSGVTSLVVSLEGPAANFRLNKFGVGYAPTSFDIPANTWTHCAVSYVVNGALIYYLNGVAHTTTTWTQTFTAENTKTIGGHYFSGSLTQPLDGIVGEAWGENRIMTASEVQQNFLGTRWRY